ncbi:MAG: hypothetical protein ACR2PW_07445 [Gammaproteobacteria bacterium]
MRLPPVAAYFRARLQFFSRPAIALNQASYPAKSLGIDPALISTEAVDVASRLSKAGFPTWLVGGGVRDLLLGITPKDFDLVTCARPQQIVKLFPRAQQVGRRFILVLLPLGRGQHLEIATLRKSPKAISHEGIIIDDNNWSDSITDDVKRRDFTLNALYMDPVQGTVQDFTGGIEHIRQGQIHMIGDPELRLAEDPARILRLLRMQAKYQLKVPEQLLKTAKKKAALVRKLPAARWLLEMEKLLLRGYSQTSIQLLREFKLLPMQYMPGEKALSAKLGYDVGRLWQQILSSTDRHSERKYGTASQRSLNVQWSGLLAALLWPACQLKSLHTKIPSDPDLWLNWTDAIVLKQPFLQSTKQQRASIAQIWRIQASLERDRVPPNLLRSNHFSQALWTALMRKRAGDASMAKLDHAKWKSANSQVRTHNRRKPRGRRTKP